MKKPQYTRHATVSIETILPLIKLHWNGNERVKLETGHTVGVTSLRLKTFSARAIDGKMHCITCGLQATHFAVESFLRDKDKSHPHINLYGVDNDGEDVLFTHDHTLARSLGGDDKLHNTQIMCSPCNSHKSIGEREQSKAMPLKKLKV